MRGKAESGLRALGWALPVLLRWNSTDIPKSPPPRSNPKVKAFYEVIAGEVRYIRGKHFVTWPIGPGHNKNHTPRHARRSNANKSTDANRAARRISWRRVA